MKLNVSSGAGDYRWNVEGIVSPDRTEAAAYVFENEKLVLKTYKEGEFTIVDDADNAPHFTWTTKTSESTFPDKTIADFLGGGDLKSLRIDVDFK